MQIAISGAQSRTILFITLFTLCITGTLALAAGKAKMNGKDVIVETGVLASHNDRTGEIVLNLTDGGTGDWKMSKQMKVFHGKEKIGLAEAGKGQKLRIYVTAEGVVEGLFIIDQPGTAKPASQPKVEAEAAPSGGQHADGAAPPAKKNIMHGKEVFPEIGKIVMLNEKQRKLTMNMDNGSQGKWSIHPQAVVKIFNSKESVPLAELLRASKVKAWVSQDGVVHWLYIMALKELKD